MQKETGEKANSGLLEGDKPYLQHARNALPILVRQAKFGQKIYYADLAEEIGMPNPRNLNYPLGAIGNALLRISEIWHEPIPPIQCLVLNQNTEQPGEGINWFLDEDKKKKFLASTRGERKQIVQNLLAEVFLYPKWDEVLAFLGLKPLENNFSLLLALARQSGKGGTGEGPEHLAFKEWVFNNPTSLKFGASIRPKQMEYLFPTQDRIDVVFEGNDVFIGIEVKSHISGPEDILRGLMQCVKYSALIRAEQTLKGKVPSDRVILALEGPIPASLIPIKNLLGVEVIDNLGRIKNEQP